MIPVPTHSIVLMSDSVTVLDELRYVAQIFRDVTGVSLEVRGPGETAESGLVIHYADQPPSSWRGIFIPRLSLTDRSNLVKLHCDGPLAMERVIHGSEILIYHTETVEVFADGVDLVAERIVFCFDLFQNAFLRLSCAAERRVERDGHSVSGYRPRHLPAEFYAKPAVNYLFELLLAALERLGPGISPRRISSTQILITHDIDAVRKTWLKGGKQAAFNLYNVARLVWKRRWVSAARLVRRNFDLLLGPNDFDQFYLWEEMGAALLEPTVFHVYVREPRLAARRSRTERWIDPDYDLVNDSNLRDSLLRMNSVGAALGLHGSYASFDDAERLAAQKRILEESCQVACVHIRQHWLRFSFERTWHAQEEAGFLFDTGFGFNDTVGFRSGLAHSHHPWDEKARRARAITIIPMIAMDATVFDYILLEPPDVDELLSRLVAETRKFGGCANFNWHTHGASRAYGWHRVLADLQLPRKEKSHAA